MSGIEFEENNYQYSPGSYTNSSQNKMAEWMIDKGLAKDQKSAEVIMIVATVIFFGAAIWVFANTFSTPNPGPNDGVDELLLPQEQI